MDTCYASTLLFPSTFFFWIDGNPGRLLNTLHSSPVVRPDARGQDNNASLNITKFLAACVAHGLPSSELFLPLDLVEASGYSLARVAGTVIALAQSSESPQSAAPKVIRAPTPADDHLPAAQRAAEDLEEWVESFIALTRQKMISDQLAGDVANLAEPDNEFVRIFCSFFSLGSYLRSSPVE